MEVIDRFVLDQKVESVKEDPVKRQILRVLLKYELQSLLQRLAEIGEESVVVTANIVDGTHSVLSSDQGEKFLHDGVVSHFMDHFVRFLFTGEMHNIPEGGVIDGCRLKQKTCVQELNQSISSVSSEEPETFMHMKKHQIEQYNRQKDHEDRNIDETVSQLVKNILREGKEKEKKTIETVAGGPNHPPIRRKRSFNFHNSVRKGSNKNYGCSDAKKMNNTLLIYPTSPPILGTNDSVNEGMVSPSDTNQDYESESIGETGDRVITIKIEPNDMDEYEGAQAVNGDDNSAEESSQDKDYVMYIESDIDRTSKENDGRSTNVKGADDLVHMVTNSNEESDNCENSVNDANDKIVNRGSEFVTAREEEEELSLPMVEEFYQNRDKSFEDVKITAKDHGTDEPKTPKEKYTSCYKQSRKKSNTFNLVLNGYLYIKDKQSNTGTVYWKCGRPGCKGRVIQRGQELITSQIHIHAPLD